MATVSQANRRFTHNFVITAHIAARELLIQSRNRNKFFSDVFSHFLGVAPILLITFALSGSSVDGSGVSEVTRNHVLFVILGYTAFMAFGFGTPIMLYSGMAFAITEEVHTGTIERNFLAPVPRTLIVLGMGAYYVALYAFHVITLVILAALLLGSQMELTTEGILIACNAVVGLLFLSVGLGVASAGLYLLLRDGSFFILIVHRPFMVLSGAIFIIDLLPTPLQWIARVNPVTYGIDAFRGSLNGSETLLSAWLEVGIVYGAGLIVLTLGIWSFRSVIQKQLMTGELTRM